MRVSVVIGTYNRAALLEGALAALGRQEVPHSWKWEILVVDNNSRDATREVIAAFANKTAAPVRYVFEARQGVSHARNRGIREARGSIVAFTDDDVLPAPDWIARIVASIDRWNADGAGGRILPRWEASPPSWLAENRNLLDRLSIMDVEGSRLLELPLKRPQVWGANMAFRRELFEKVGEFDERRGITGKKLYRGEETELINRALGLGARIVYDPSITVFHRIGADRMRRGYFRKLSFDHAQGEALVKSTDNGTPTFAGAPLSTYRAAAASLVKWMALALLRRPRTFDQQLGCWETLGQLSGYWKRALSGSVEVSGRREEAIDGGPRLRAESIEPARNS